MSDLEDYIKQDRAHFEKLVAQFAVGHLCFTCRRQIDADVMVTTQLIGPFPVYNHTACLFTEDQVQVIKEKADANGGIYRIGGIGSDGRIY